ncbi:MAG: Ku protein [Dehalococcoidia bacterium]|nr:Ku protein [Dehalococcoidia bacterium]
MPRSIWNGLISFGMVSIPVKLFTATESKDISFRLLHRECNSRLKQLRWCPACEREVEWGETVRGYEYAKDQHVIVSDEDFDKLPLPSRRTIELAAFVKAEEIDPVYYEKSYYLEPDEVGIKPFALLMKALKEKSLTAVAKIAIRNKERLCALRPMDGTLMLETLYYPDEIRVERGTEVPEVQVSDRELEMASTLIDLLADSFEPEKYQDEYRRALMEIIEAKLQGEEFVEAPAPAPAKVTDLMAALKASVEAAKKRRGEEAGEETGRGRRAAAG